uniref:protein-tyrosine-phosphatase n=1 Tax=Meloidogyne enterolobii TaxID=390850 RepID=A0A6V7TLA9_MELEN|nr:unnamed protein product [Meloidogyne enterolobii]
MRGGDDRILSRHLASDRSTGSFRGNSENFGFGGNSFFDGLHPNRNSMGNSSLRRSMPSVNNDNEKIINTKEERGDKQQLNINNRHASFCLDTESSERKVVDGLGALAFGGGNKKENNKSEKIRCTSAHSFSSLTPSSSSAVFTTDFSDHSNAAPALDTKQIEFFLSKREDSLTTITTTLSDEMDNLNESQSKQTNPSTNIHQQRSVDQPFSSPLSSISTVKASGGGGNNILRNSQKIFRSADTRSSIFSVSSSLDSTKEEKIISNFEHTKTSNRVVVLPKPSYNNQLTRPSLYPETSNVLLTNEEEKIIESSGRSCSAEHQRIGSTSPLDRRPSMDSNNRKPSNSNRDSNPTESTSTNLHLSSWHSVSDFQNINKINKNTNKDLLKTITSTNSINNQSNNNEIWRSPPTNNRPQSQSGIRRSNYLGAIVWQVDETVYCGGIEAALNQNLLCRLNIEYIVDLSGHEDDPALVNTRPRSEYPCLCPKRTAHSRMTMSIKIKDDSHQQMLNRDTRPSINETKAQALEREEIIHYFETLIDLIRKARISQKKVLIHSLRGRNRAPAFVAAYLMHCNRVTRVRAINKITKMMSSNRPGICISDTLQKALMRWQSMLGIRAESSRLDSQQLNKLFEVKRTAWN